MRSVHGLGLCGLAVMGGLTSFASAAPEGGPGSFVLHRGAPGAPGAPVERVELRNLPQVVLVDRPVVAPAAAVGRALAEQPVHPYLAEVRLISQTTYIDPDADYNCGVGRLDDNHWILKAQQQYRATHSPGVLVIRGRDAQAMHDRAPRNAPSMILLRPNVLDKRPQQDDGEKMPSVPEPPSKPGKQVAMAGSVSE